MNGNYPIFPALEKNFETKKYTSVDPKQFSQLHSERVICWNYVDFFLRIDRSLLSLLIS